MMTPVRQRLAWMINSLGILMAALLLAAIIPHHHAESAAPDPDDSCQACRLVDGVDAVPPDALVLSPIPQRVGFDIHVPLRPARPVLVPRNSAPRAPPF